MKAFRKSDLNEKKYPGSDDLVLHLQIENQNQNFLDNLLESALVYRFVVINDLVFAIFESMPMLVIQYINNYSKADGWNSRIVILTFTSSVVMIVLNCIKLIITLYNSQIVSIIDLIVELVKWKQLNQDKKHNHKSVYIDYQDKKRKEKSNFFVIVK